MVYLYYLHRSNAALSVRRVTIKMIVRVLALIFLFLLKLRFPANKSGAEVSCKTYGADVVKRLHKFKKLDFIIRKTKPIWSFRRCVIRKV